MRPPVKPVAPNRTTSRSRVGIRSSCQGTRGNPIRQPSHGHERSSTSRTRRRRRHRTRCGIPDRHRGGQRDDDGGPADRRPDVPARAADRAGQRRPHGTRQLRGAARLLRRARRRAGRALRLGQPGRLLRRHGRRPRLGLRRGGRPSPALRSPAWSSRAAAPPAPTSRRSASTSPTWSRPTASCWSAPATATSRSTTSAAASRSSSPTSTCPSTDGTPELLLAGDTVVVVSSSGDELVRGTHDPDDDVRRLRPGRTRADRRPQLRHRAGARGPARRHRPAGAVDAAARPRLRGASLLAQRRTRRWSATRRSSASRRSRTGCRP